MRSLKPLAVALILSAPFGARTADPPHVDGLYCSNCHKGHNALGAGLTKASGNFALCDSCHSAESGLVAGIVGEATPGVSGRSHRWDANASNLGATPPSLAPGGAEAEMAKRLDNGNLMCSTCHDQHAASAFPVSGRGKQHISGAKRAINLGGTGTVTPTSAPAGMDTKGYLLEFTKAGAVDVAEFRVSNDNGISWQQAGVVAAATVTLNDNVVIAFGGGSFIQGERYAFYVSYPFLRVDNTDGAMCVICHKDRNMSPANVMGTGLVHQGTSGTIVPGTTVFHHPVGPLASQGAILDANGGAQGTDSNPTNDLELGSGAQLTCLTCHRVHKADSNSLTLDQ